MQGQGLGQSAAGQLHTQVPVLLLLSNFPSPVLFQSWGRDQGVSCVTLNGLLHLSELQLSHLRGRAQESTQCTSLTPGI